MQRFPLFLYSLFFFLFFLSVNQQAFGQSRPLIELEVGTVEGVPGDTVCVSVTVKGFEGIIGSSFNIALPAQEEIIAVNPHPALSAAGEPYFNYYKEGAPDGYRLFRWAFESFGQAVTLPDEAILFEVCFKIPETFPNESNTSLALYITDEEGIYFYHTKPGFEFSAYSYVHAISGQLLVPGPGNDLTLKLDLESIFDCNQEWLIAHLQASGGNAPYVYTYENLDKSSGSVIKSTQADSILIGDDIKNKGLYRVEVEDALGQKAYASFYYYGGTSYEDYYNPGLPSPRFGVNITYPRCGFDETPGRIELYKVSFSAEAPISYQWSTGDSTAEISNLAVGDYSVTVTHKESGCTEERTLSLIPRGRLALNFQTETAACPTDTVMASLSGGESLSYLQYQWSSGDTLANVELPSGDYRVTVTGEYCEEERQVSIPSESSFLPVDTNLFTVVQEPYSCTDSVTRIGVIQKDTLQRYDFEWSHDESEQDALIELSDFEGTLELRIKSPEQCPIRVPFQVLPARLPAAVDDFQEFLACETGAYRSGLILPNDNEIDTTLLNYHWSTGDTNRVVVLPPNQSHTLTLTYEDFCSHTYVFSTYEQPDLEVGLQLDTLYCVQDTALIGVLDTSASAKRQYTWSTGDTTPFIRVVETGAYEVVVTEGFCSDTFTVQVPFKSTYQELDTNLFSKLEQDFDCLNTKVQIGLAQLVNTEAYTFHWSHDPGLTDSIISVSEPGIYDLKVIGDNTCPYQVKFELAGPTLPEGAFSFNRLDAPDCFADEFSIGLDYGAISDTTVYSYLWNTDDTTRTIVVTPDEPYELTVTYGQDEQCTKTYVFPTLIDHPGFNLSIQNDTVYCADQRARIGLLGTETNPNLTFRWSNGDTTAFTEVLPDRTYTVTIAEGYCQEVESIYVPFVDREQPLDPDKFQTVYEPFACEGGPARVGVEQLVAGEYEFRWSHDEYFYEPIAEVDQPGRYSLEIIEEGACPVEVSFFLSEPDFIINPELVSAYTSCAEDTYQLGVVLGDSTDYSFQWSTGQTTSQIVAPAGPTYKLTVTYADNELCSRSFDFATESYALEASVKFQTCTISDNCEAVSLVRVSPGFAYTPVEYVWSDGTQRADNGSLVEFQFPANLGTLDLYVKDAKGCTDTLRNIELGCGIEKQFVADNFIPQYIECVPDSLATDQLQAVLFTEVYSNFATLPPYRFEWSNGQQDTSYFRSGQLLSSLTDVNAKVVDARGEEYIASFNEEAQLYGCGTTSSAKFVAPTLKVEPGSSFSYPVYVKDFEQLEFGLFTVQWDPCLVFADSIVVYGSDATPYSYSGELLSIGLWEFGFNKTDATVALDSVLIGEVFFTATDERTGVSPFLFALNEPPIFTEENENNGIIPVHGSITVADPEDLVTPGDTDEDGAVGHKDLLNIGLGYATQGPDRRSVDVSRQAFGFSWNEDLPRSQTNYKNIDCDGDGFISEVDLTAIHQNWTYDRPLTTGEVHLGAPELFVRRDTLDAAAEELRVPLELGLSFDAVDRMHGIAFSIGYDPTVVDEESLAFESAPSWLLPEETPLSIVRLDTQLHLLRVALTNTDRIDRAGYGPIGHLRFKLKDIQQEVTFEFGDVLALDAAEERVLVNGSTSTVFIRNTSTNTQKTALEQAIKVYPQPVGDWLYLDYPVGRIQTYSICDLSGRNVSGTKPIDFRINLAGLTPGMYLLQLYTDSGLIHKKIMKVNP